MSWIDALLVAAGTGLAVTGSPLAGAPLVALGLVLPGLRVVTGRGASGRNPARLVPPELAGAHAELRGAAALAGIPDQAAAPAAGDRAVLEVAAVLAGRPPRGAAQRRLVAVRVRALHDTAAGLRSHHESWREATAEVDALAPAGPAAPTSHGPSGPRQDGGGPLVTVLLVVLAPAFLAWELATGGVRAAGALADGVALRARTAGRAAVWAGRGTATLAARTARRWVSLRHRVAAAAAEARARFLAARLRARLRLRGRF